MGALKITGQSAPPTVTASDKGTLYYDSDTNKLRHYNGTAWADVSPAAAAITSADLPAGSVIQVKQTIHTEKEEITGATGQNNYADMPGMSVSSFVTTGSNEALVNVCATLGNGTTGYATFWRLVRVTSSVTTALCIGTEPLSNQGSATARTSNPAANSEYLTSMMFLDSPGAGTHEYKVQWQAENGSTGYLNRPGNDSNPTGNYYVSTPSTITVMEVSV